MERITIKDISPSKKYAMKINLAFKGKAFIIHRRVYICHPHRLRRDFRRYFYQPCRLLIKIDLFGVRNGKNNNKEYLIRKKKTMRLHPTFKVCQKIDLQDYITYSCFHSNRIHEWPGS